MTSTVIPFPDPKRTKFKLSGRINAQVIFPRELTYEEHMQAAGLLLLGQLEEAAELFGGKLTFPKE